jgi:subtilisin family serine protease
MKKLVFIFILFAFQFIDAQEHAWVYFTDKPDEVNALANPLTMLSQRALDRRTRQGIALDYKDVPLSNDYYNQIAVQNGILVRAKSKWLNAVHVYGSETDINALSSLSFVQNIEFADKSLNTRLNNNIIQHKNKFDEFTTYNYGGSFNQAHQIRVDFLHEQNFTGNTMIIAILDAGFPGVDAFSAFQNIRDNNQILGGYNFVERSPNIYQDNRHGMSVLSTIAGFVDGELVGTAPDAQFYLFTTEDNNGETPLEESLWVEAAEKADSLGVDIINTSLGYQDFDESRYDHVYSEMDGQTTFISRGANVAVERGMIVVVAAGNDGNNTYFNIGSPADATNVFTIGAVDEFGDIVGFSSYGPSYDNRIKPDVCAKGGAATIIDAFGDVTTGSGTSYASPIMAGAIACFWEAYPNKTNFEIMQLIRESASLYNNPTDQEGYGIPNFENAFQTIASVSSFSISELNAYPNPAKDFIQIKGIISTDFYEITLFDSLGKILMNKTVHSMDKIDLSNFNDGVYLLNIIDEKNTKNIKIIKE